MNWKGGVKGKDCDPISDHLEELRDTIKSQYEKLVFKLKLEIRRPRNKYGALRSIQNPKRSHSV
jgi:hypothetical protein